MHRCCETVASEANPFLDKLLSPRLGANLSQPDIILHFIILSESLALSIDVPRWKRDPGSIKSFTETQCTRDHAVFLSL